ncbi:SpoIVB peptidase [uncultured Eubacterium sp.]|uniref:SpoIVB peptidase n=1 Tax=uncultured Eubacterium sp. TaxID=165185 RepID=UPI002636292F|nr:SpoIVB peptidase [uncultured Eubacterium sp.]
MKKAIRIFDVILFVICVVIFGVIIWGNAALPSGVVTYNGNSEPLAKVFTYTGKSTSLAVDKQTATPRRENLKLFGIIPVKEVTVTEKAEQKVMVSGEVFGIKLYTDGVIVVGIQEVQTDSGKKSPSGSAGIEVGDIIVAIDGENVYTSDQVQSILGANNGGSFEVKIKRGERYRDYTVTPVYCEREGCYKAGMWVRDSTAGIGTITFYNKQSGIFAALGHQINDIDTKEIMPMLDGEAVKATVSKIEKSTRGTTGSLECDFTNQTLGKLLSNTDCGIYGAYAEISECAKEYPVAAIQEVKKGKATLISTVEKGQPKKYEIEITHIGFNENNREKNMIVKVTDKDLIDKTGGIIQGMSGSPIIQNGKLVGALTHVIVGNPQKGYAVFAQTMAEESNN